MNKTLRTIFGFVFLFIGVFCLWQAVPRSVSSSAIRSVSPEAHAAISEPTLAPGTILTTPIQDVRVGQRVLAHNPEVDHQERQSRGPEPDFGQWLYLQLEMPKEDGSTLHIKLLRPKEWFDSQVRYVVRDIPADDGVERRKTQNDSTAEPLSLVAGTEKGIFVGRIKEQRDAAPAAATGSDENIAGTALRSVRPTENAEHGAAPASAADTESSAFGSPPSALSSPVPLSPLRPVFFDLAVASATVEDAGGQLLGLAVDLDLPEMGAAGTAIITDILPTPSIEPPVDHHDQRQVVTATFRHPPSTTVLDAVFVSEAEWDDRAADVGRIQEQRDAAPAAANGDDGDIAGTAFRSVRSTSIPSDAASNSTSAGSRSDSHRPLAAPNNERPVGTGPTANNSPSSASPTSLSVTSNHLFWSVDRQEFIEIGQMDLGERVQTFHGETKRLASKLPRPGPPQEVYNLEVYGEHVYFVGDEQLLAHNNCAFDRYRQLRRAGWNKDSAKAIVRGEFGRPIAPKKGVEIALGRGKNLRQFASDVRASSWQNWVADRVTRRSPLRRNFGRAFTDAARKARRIHFSLEDIDDVAEFARQGRRGFDYANRRNFTNTELFLIKSTPDLLKKTTFYRNGVVVPSPF